MLTDNYWVEVNRGLMRVDPDNPQGARLVELPEGRPKSVSIQPSGQILCLMPTDVIHFVRSEDGSIARTDDRDLVSTLERLYTSRRNGLAVYALTKDNQLLSFSTEGGTVRRHWTKPFNNQVTDVLDCGFGRIAVGDDEGMVFILNETTNLIETHFLVSGRVRKFLYDDDALIGVRGLWILCHDGQLWHSTLGPRGFNPAMPIRLNGDRPFGCEDAVQSKGTHLWMYENQENQLVRVNFTDLQEYVFDGSFSPSWGDVPIQLENQVQDNIIHMTYHIGNDSFGGLWLNYGTNELIEVNTFVFRARVHVMEMEGWDRPGRMHSPWYLADVLFSNSDFNNDGRSNNDSVTSGPNPFYEGYSVTSGPNPFYEGS